MEKLEYMRDINVIAGISNGYYFIIKPNPQQNTSTLQINIKDNVSWGLKDFLKDLYKEHKGIGRRYTAPKTSILIPIHLKEIDMDLEFPVIIDSITEFLNEKGAVQVSAISGQEHDLDVYRINDNVEIMSSSEFSEQSQKEESFYNNKGNPILGYLGAIGGIAIGVIAWVVISVNFNYIVGLIGLLMVFLGYKGYEKFGGRLTRTAVIMIFLLSIAGVIIAEVVSTTIALGNVFNELGYSITFWESLTELFPFAMSDSEIAVEVYKNIGFGLLFTVLAGFGVARQSFQETKRDFLAYQVFRQDATFE
ncbi:hypothetical protein G7062_01490 [Erysipelothrix sp. HDW6C]|uniref:hypothetical protein n=1 Tax=Erysipelothrix sp. HDW6C TaxID=2714930 RepID=UPI00140C2F3F|nr:hypothetical protein [Erysipelothrix sp. HDW6C]QIK69034.1 hypothetical protein G7062_01490 [Erysipelothrix sp. HDW6C]